MRNELCQRLGIAVPIFTFTHCRNVVVAVSEAGLGVPGAVGMPLQGMVTFEAIRRTHTCAGVEQTRDDALSDGEDSANA